MAEYIEREAAIAWFMPYAHAGESIDAGVLIADIKGMKSADVSPVRHGRWITTPGEVFPGSSQFLCYSHKHEECGFQYVDMDENEYDYCPNCGCRMDGGIE